jgi:hypothetical protein
MVDDLSNITEFLRFKLRFRTWTGLCLWGRSSCPAQCALALQWWWHGSGLPARPTGTAGGGAADSRGVRAGGGLRASRWRLGPDSWRDSGRSRSESSEVQRVTRRLPGSVQPGLGPDRPDVPITAPLQRPGPDRRCAGQPVRRWETSGCPGPAT